MSVVTRVARRLGREIKTHPRHARRVTASSASHTAQMFRPSPASASIGRTFEALWIARHNYVLYP